MKFEGPGTGPAGGAADAAAGGSGDRAALGDRLRKAGDLAGAAAAYLEAAFSTEHPPASLCVKLART